MLLARNFAPISTPARIWHHRIPGDVAMDFGQFDSPGEWQEQCENLRPPDHRCGFASDQRQRARDIVRQLGPWRLPLAVARDDNVPPPRQ